MTSLDLLVLGTSLSIVKVKDNDAVPYVNSETDFGSYRIVEGADYLIYISDTDGEQGH
jgi:hypothetical protein